MSDENTAWKVFRHWPIERLEDNLWRVQGTLPGIPLYRVMTVIKRADGTLVIHGGIALEEDAMKEIEAWGTPAVLVVPNQAHRLDAARFKARYPNLRVYCPRPAKKKVEEIVPVDATYESFPNGDDLRVEPLDGLKGAEGVFVVQSGARTSLIFNDAVFNMAHRKGLPGFIFKYLTQSSGGPRVSRLVKLFFVKQKGAFRAHLERLSELPNLVRVIVAHHETITENPSAALKTAASTL